MIEKKKKNKILFNKYILRQILTLFGIFTVNTIIYSRPSSVTYIGPYALYRTESLSAIDFKGTKSQWNNISK